MNSIKDIKNVYYINLENRIDRNKNVSNELNKIGIFWEKRFNAIKMKNGAIGCSMSHLKCLENARLKNLDHILIVEDDIEFLDPELFVKQMNRFLHLHSDDWDVVLIAGNNMVPHNIIDNTCVKVTNCQTTTGYLVKSCYYDKLIKNIKEGIELLLKNPQEKNKYAIDKYWLQLQKEDCWYLIIPLSVVQREDYSDIEGKVTNFKSYMTNLDKEYKSRK